MPMSLDDVLSVAEYRRDLRFIQVRNGQGQAEWTIQRHNSYLGAFPTLAEAIAGAWAALMVTQQTDAANALWQWREQTLRRVA